MPRRPAPCVPPPPQQRPSRGLGGPTLPFKEVYIDGIRTIVWDGTAADAWGSPATDAPPLEPAPETSPWACGGRHNSNFWMACGLTALLTYGAFTAYVLCCM